MFVFVSQGFEYMCRRVALEFLPLDLEIEKNTKGFVKDEERGTGHYRGLYTNYFY